MAVDIQGKSAVASKKRMRMIFFFIDGFGIGGDDPRKNPLLAADAPYLRELLRTGMAAKIDACLGVPGLPQSATGQTAIFSGVNAAAVLGRHLNGQPTITLIKILKECNLFAELVSRGVAVTNANAYRDEYLEKMLDPRERRYRPSVTSVMTMAAGLPFRTIREYGGDMAVCHDITGRVLVEYGYEKNEITPEEAAVRLYTISRGYGFTLFEHFMTDIIGHTTDMGKAAAELRMLDRFVGKLTGLMDFDGGDILLITSDHGNIEDITVKTHTCNPVPLILLGPASMPPPGPVCSITDIMPLVLRFFDKNASTDIV